MKKASTDRKARAAAKYREAARKVAEGEELGVVLALGAKFKNRYSEAMRPYFCIQGRFWEWTYETGACELRILALCLMAAMVEAGDA